MNYRSLFISIIILLMPSLGIAQESSDLKTHARIDFGFSGLGFGVELPLSKKILLEVATGFGAGYNITSNEYKYNWVLDDPSIYTTLHAKYYYNREKRLNKGKSVKFNAGNFFGVKAKYATETLSGYYNYNTLLGAVHWGIQRSLSNHFAFEFYLGAGVAQNLERGYGSNTVFFPDMNIRISYVFRIQK